MRGLYSLVWALLVGGMLLGIGALIYTKTIYGPNGPQEGLEQFQAVRDLDAKARSHLDDLGIRFRPDDHREPTLNLENPTETDFAFLESVLRSNDARGRFAAARVLRDIGAVREVGPLIAAARGTDPKLDSHFVECALTIVANKPPEAVRASLIPALQAHLEEQHDSLEPELKKILRVKLEQAGTFDPAFLREAAVSDRDPAVRRFCLDELAREKRPPLGVFAAALADWDSSVRDDAHRHMETLDRVALGP